jgi:hypothetical protein
MARARFQLTAGGVAAVTAIVGAGLLGWWVYRKGWKGVGRAAAAVPGAVVTGGLDIASAALGIPGPSETSTDPRVARWIVDNYGWFMASKWVGVPALVSAGSLQAGTGTPPPAGSPAYEALPKARVISDQGLPINGLW